MKASQKLFGTDGIRGKANQYPITPEMALRFGQAVAHECRNGNAQPTLIIGRDSRHSGPMLEMATASGAASMGCNVLLTGILPTPAIAYLVSKRSAIAGIVISASHNSYEDNGLKVFQCGGLKCNDESEARIADLILGDKLELYRSQSERIGTISHLENAAEHYAATAKKDFAGELNLSRFKIAVDAAQGAAYQTTPLVLSQLGAKVFPFFNQPDGCNINRDCGSNYPEVISRLVKETGADLGIAHDGDADRACFCDEKGEVLDGDEVLAIFGLHFLKQGKLRNKTLVATVMSNLGLDECLEKAGAKVLRSAVGDRYVFESLQKHDLNVGGEQSGHIILRDYNQTGDGLNTALQLLRVMVETGKPLSELRKSFFKYPQLLINLAVREKKPIEDLAEVNAAVLAVEKQLGQRGRILLRYSGTESKIRLLIEAREKESLESLAEKILKPLKAALT